MTRLVLVDSIAYLVHLSQQPAMITFYLLIFITQLKRILLTYRYRSSSLAHVTIGIPAPACLCCLDCIPCLLLHFDLSITLIADGKNCTPSYCSSLRHKWMWLLCLKTNCYRSQVSEYRLLPSIRNPCSKFLVRQRRVDTLYINNCKRRINVAII